MAYISVHLDSPVFHGRNVTFRSPADCSQVSGLKIYYPIGDGEQSVIFALTDAHGSDVAGNPLFAENVLVKVILDTESNKAFVQNSDTNAYLENKFNNMGTKQHTHSASDITGGTFAGAVVANGSGQTPGSYLVRNQKLSASEETPTVNGAICWLYE